MVDIEIPHGEDKEGEKHVGITIAIIAVIMALVGSFGTNAANDRIAKSVESSNGFAWYQAKRQREALNELEVQRIGVELASAPSPGRQAALEKLATELLSKNKEYKSENEEIQKKAKEADVESKHAAELNEGYDHAEILLQIAVVLCSLTLLTGSKLFVRVGIVLALAGVLWGGKTFVSKPHEAATEHAVAK